LYSVPEEISSGIEVLDTQRHHFAILRGCVGGEAAYKWKVAGNKGSPILLYSLSYLVKIMDDESRLKRNPNQTTKPHHNPRTAPGMETASSTSM